MSDTLFPARDAPVSRSSRRVDDTDVHWFGASARRIGNRPDTRYGWLDHSSGPCIVKAMDSELVAYNASLLSHERQMLAVLAEVNAPVPVMVDIGQPDWLVTRFAGLSLQALQRDGAFGDLAAGYRFPWIERISVWIHLLKRLQLLANEAVLAIDLYDANVLVPLAQGCEGQLLLNTPILIDHAHTLKSGKNIRRPVWMDIKMDRIPPELRDALGHDQRILQQKFDEAGAALPGYSRMPEDRDRWSRQVWAEYDQPQHLQELIDTGHIPCDLAMQYSAGVALRALEPVVPTESKAALARIVQRMTQPAPGDRYPTLNQAAEELRQLIPRLPQASSYRYAAVGPDQLKAIQASKTELARPASSTTVFNPADDGTRMAAPNELPQPIVTAVSAEPARRKSRAALWIAMAAGLGGALGWVLPLPW